MFSIAGGTEKRFLFFSGNRSFNKRGRRSGCFQCAAAPWKFARKIARPPSFVRMALAEIWGFSSLTFSGSGGRGKRTRQTTALEELGCGGLCPHPLRKLSFLRTFLLLPRRWTKLPSASKLRRKPLPQRRSAAALHFAYTRNAPQRFAPLPQRRKPRRLNAAAVARGLRPLITNNTQLST